jgi:hypothetical protein
MVCQPLTNIQSQSLITNTQSSSLLKYLSTRKTHQRRRIFLIENGPLVQKHQTQYPIYRSQFQFYNKNIDISLEIISKIRQAYPVSFTVTKMVAVYLSIPSILTVKVIVPVSVNFSALDNKFDMICFTLWSSPKTDLIRFKESNFF